MRSLTRVGTALTVASTALLGVGGFQEAAAASVQTVTAAAMGRVARWRWSAWCEWRRAASPSLHRVPVPLQHVAPGYP